MTIKKRMYRSNIIMLVIPIVIAGVLLAAGAAAGVLVLDKIYLPQFGLTFQDLVNTGEQLEDLMHGLETLIKIYFLVVAGMLICMIAFTNCFLSRSLFKHIKLPLDQIVDGVQRIKDGNLDQPICYSEKDEFKEVCDAIDDMAFRLKESLIQQQNELQKKQELIAGLSHDLKSPLTTIRAYTEALLEGIDRDDNTRQRYLQTIYAKETDMESLINRLFMLSKTGTYEIHTSIFNLVDIVNQCTEEYIGLEINCCIPSDIQVKADMELLKRSIANILDNSRKYGSSRMTITAEAEEETVVLHFLDNGPGVEETQLSKIFEPFYRTDSARKDPGSGSGLGLTVVKTSICQMNGTVSAENGKNGGLCITIKLPAVKEMGLL